MKSFLKCWPLVLVLACGLSPHDTAQTILHASTEAVVTSDQVAAKWYAQEAKEALDASVDRASYNEWMKGPNAVETSLQIARSALLALQSGLDVWSNGSRGDWDKALPCAVDALLNLFDAMLSAGVDPPKEIGDAIGLGRSLLGGMVCEVSK